MHYTPTKRVVSVRRNTVGFILNNNKRVSLKEAVALANKGRIRGVRVVSNYNCDYLQSTSGKTLLSLPEVVS